MLSLLWLPYFSLMKSGKHKQKELPHFVLAYAHIYAKYLHNQTSGNVSLLKWSKSDKLIRFCGFDKNFQEQLKINTVHITCVFPVLALPIWVHLCWWGLMMFTVFSETFLHTMVAIWVDISFLSVWKKSFSSTVSEIFKPVHLTPTTISQSKSLWSYVSLVGHFSDLSLVLYNEVPLHVELQSSFWPEGQFQSHSHFALNVLCFVYTYWDLFLIQE